MNFVIGRVYIIHCTWIVPPHDKICLCVCDQRNWFFWFNSSCAFHNIGQLAVGANCHPAIAHDCFLDLSGVKSVSPQEARTARDRGPIDAALSAQIKAVLSVPIARLPDLQRLHALGVL
jgi:hypothetical protein